MTNKLWLKKEKELQEFEIKKCRAGLRFLKQLERTNNEWAKYEKLLKSFKGGHKK